MVPSECAITVCAGPKRVVTASRALPISTRRAVPRGPEGPGSEVPVSGRVEQTTRQAGRGQRRDEAASWLPRPAQPWTR